MYFMELLLGTLTVMRSMDTEEMDEYRQVMESLQRMIYDNVPAAA